MSRKITKVSLLAALVGFCLVAGGCSGTDTTTDAPVGFSVDIVVPYATTTPAPEEDDSGSPLKIDANGNVTLSDISWIDSGFAGADLADAAKYYTQLRLGDSGSAVRNLQARLKALDYYSGEISGVFDSATEDAVKLFELTYGSMQTGIATVKMQGLLFAPTAPVYNSNAYKAALTGNYVTLQYGSTGTGVYALQERLKTLGYPIAEVTGIYDDDTAEAVRLFYAAYGLEESEIAIVAMQKELFSENARTYAKEGSGAQITLSAGNIGTLVSQLQEKLIGLGYLSGSATGTFDDATAEAVCALQRKLGLEETGQADPSLQDMLLGDEAPSANASIAEVDDGTLRQGSTGDEVAQLQQRLIELGFTDVQATGTFDDATAYAISLFQGEADLVQTGTASKALIEFIYSDNADIHRKTEELLESSPQAPVDEPETHMLSIGSTGEEVDVLQERLKELGYLKKVGEEFDGNTEEALRDFQTAIGVEATGTASPAMQVYLMSRAAPETGIIFYEDGAPTFTSLSLGDSGDAVEELQVRLYERGFFDAATLAASAGTFDNATQIAVANAQIAMGYPEADGVAGVEFQAFLFSKYGNYLDPDD